MQLFPRQVPFLCKPEKHNSRQLPVLGSPGLFVCLIALSAIGFAAAVARPLPSEEPVFSSDGMQEFRIPDLAGGSGGQAAMSGHTFAINSNAFNLMREKEIAKDTAKLLQLAIALKTELGSDSGSEPSAAALAKASEIEKLAKHVKSKMTISPTRPLY